MTLTPHLLHHVRRGRPAIYKKKPPTHLLWCTTRPKTSSPITHLFSLCIQPPRFRTATAKAAKPSHPEGYCVCVCVSTVLTCHRLLAKRRKNKAPQWCPAHTGQFVCGGVCPIKADKGIPWLATVLSAGPSKGKAHSDTLVGWNKAANLCHMRGGRAGASGVTAFCARYLMLTLRKGRGRGAKGPAHLILSAALSDLRRRRRRRRENSVMEFSHSHFEWALTLYKYTHTLIIKQ